VDREWRITSFNRAAEKITKTSSSEANGRFCSEVFRSSMCETECALWRTQKTRKAISCQSGYIIGAEGARVPVSVSTAVLRDGQEQIIGGALSCR
jgi:PAS domain-containing protein